jgi:predicted AlkP superfamily phosphohydrolase/phosphomutase
VHFIKRIERIAGKREPFLCRPGKRKQQKDKHIQDSKITLWFSSGPPRIFIFAETRNSAHRGKGIDVNHFFLRRRIW